MIVLDTNVFVRLITKDDVEQARLAAALLAGPGPFWVSRVVLLETAWVLRSRYKFDRAAINRALGIVVALPRTEVEDRARTEAALLQNVGGMDLGDAFILASAPDGATLASFDREFVARASGAPGGIPAQLVGDLLAVRDRKVSPIARKQGRRGK